MPRNKPTPQDCSQDLRGLWAIKRHEVPPPGYFVGFSDKVMARIEAGERLEPERWWTRLRHVLFARPSLATGFGAFAAIALMSALGLAPSKGPTVANADMLITGAPAMLQTALLEWPAEVQVQNGLSGGVSPLGSGSVAPLMVGRTGGGGILVQKINYSAGF